MKKKIMILGTVGITALLAVIGSGCCDGTCCQLLGCC